MEGGGGRSESGTGETGRADESPQAERWRLGALLPWPAGLAAAGLPVCGWDERAPLRGQGCGQNDISM